MTNIADKELRDKVIISLWNEGLTGKQIADAISTTRSAVMGRIHRMRLSGIELESRDTDGTKARRASIKKREKGKDAIQKLAVTVAEETIDGRNKKTVTISDLQLTFSYFEEKPMEENPNVDILGLTSRSCRYVVETPNGDCSGLYCGKEKYKNNYCQEHYKLCYVPAPKKR